jgi:hypothetical protein
MPEPIATDELAHCRDAIGVLNQRGEAVGRRPRLALGGSLGLETSLA